MKWWRLEPRAAPLRLYLIGATCLALYASLGKLAYKYVNYVTGTVLKSIKLVPVMIVSVTWLGRSYPPHDYAAAGFLTSSAVMFGLGEAESNREANYAMGFALSFVCLGLTAAQSNIADACMRDHGAGVDETGEQTQGGADGGGHRVRPDLDGALARGDERCVLGDRGLGRAGESVASFRRGEARRPDDRSDRGRPRDGQAETSRPGA